MKNATRMALNHTAIKAVTFLLPIHRFFQNRHSVEAVYTNLCLWFHTVRVKTNLKLVFMFVNILLPSKRHGVFM